MFTEQAYDASLKINQLQIDFKQEKKVKQNRKSTGLIDAKTKKIMKALIACMKNK
ncbi:unnamed protein product [Paramecium sonneborni]|uniref:Uncharacterized protein n=1 Tax=Paramecium sonneborni TaxID=65129 RepID=A0A8S1NZH9_9CILI|nr:unnamed protein product [Paramecium sonneborni]